MNFLDVILIILIVICLVGGIITSVISFIEDDKEFGFGIITVAIIVIGFLSIPFIVIDKASGSTLGMITSVDKNFFGTTALYIKTAENNEEEYCIEFDKKLEKQANGLIGEKVKISYGKRVGIYLTSKCHQAPVNKIEKVEK